MENELFAAVMTGKGTGAISTIQVCGENPESVIRQIFKPASDKPLAFETGQILLGTIYDEDKTIDQVTIGCEEQSTFAINCHGNPLIVEMIIQLLKKHGVKIVTTKQLQTKILSSQKQTNAIAIEAQIVQHEIKTLEGTKIVFNQINHGLGKTIQNWLANIDDISIDTIQKQAEDILRNSSIARLIIYGCKVILTGPPNSGKSTLLNCFAGREKAIVTDISGTTRDWITAQCKIDSLSLELIDTAGLDENLSECDNDIDNVAQEKTLELINQADLVLLVLDNSRDDELDRRITEVLSGKKIITVLNKADLPAKFNVNKLPDYLANIMQISAKEQKGIENLIESIPKTCGVTEFDLGTVVCFTDRQENLLEKIVQVQSKKHAKSIITELLNNKM